MVRHATTLKVRWGDVDSAGIVFYPRIFEWFDTASDELFAALGLGWRELFPAEGILGLPLVEAGCRFSAPVRYGDEVTIVSTITRVEAKTFRIQHEVSVGETRCAEGYEVRAWVQGAADERKRIRACEIPEAVARRLRGEGSWRP